MEDLILNLSDHATGFSKQPEEIMSCVFNILVSIFGAPSKFFSDKGCKFRNKDYNEMCKSLNIIVKKRAKSPFFNGLCERHNTVLEDMLLKVSHNKKIAIDICLQWV